MDNNAADGHLIAPHGGCLINLIVDKKRQEELKNLTHQIPSWNLTPRQICDLELLMAGGMSPLQGFMGQRDYNSVIENMHLANGVVWPMPIVLDVKEETANNLKIGMSLVLRDPEGLACAILNIEDIWQPDRLKEAKYVYGTTDQAHSGVEFLLNKVHPWYIGGTIEGLHMPVHYDFLSLRMTPQEVRNYFLRSGWSKIVAFQTRNPLHRAHFHLTLEAAKRAKANILLHPVVGLTKAGDIDRYTRVRCYQAILKYYPVDCIKLSVLPLAMRMAGPREALWHALIRKNYGCTHFIVGRDHASPGKSPQGTPWYEPYAAHELVQKFAHEIDIQSLFFNEMVYVQDTNEYIESNQATTDMKCLSISGTQLREKLALGQPIPEWFTFSEVCKVLHNAHPPKSKQGFTLFFTGLSGSGKSTLANILQIRFMEMGTRPVTLLDGDIVRQHLSSELGFSPEHRNINILRIGFVASEITKNGGIAICAPIAPYDKIRKEVRNMIDPLGGFILIHCSTSLEVCEKRDRKGLYAKARKGLIPHFTGVSDPYEVPNDAEITLDTAHITTEEAVDQILTYLEKAGYIEINCEICK